MTDQTTISLRLHIAAQGDVACLPLTPLFSLLFIFLPTVRVWCVHVKPWSNRPLLSPPGRVDRFHRR